MDLGGIIQINIGISSGNGLLPVGQYGFVKPSLFLSQWLQRQLLRKLVVDFLFLVRQGLLSLDAVVEECIYDVVATDYC